MNSSEANISRKTKSLSPGVFDIAGGGCWYEANIVRVEVHRARVIEWKEDRHTALACDIELPLRREGVPVYLAHVAGFDSDERSSNILG